MKYGLLLITIFYSSCFCGIITTARLLLNKIRGGQQEQQEQQQQEQQQQQQQQEKQKKPEESFWKGAIKSGYTHYLAPMALKYASSYIIPGKYNLLNKANYKDLLFGTYALRTLAKGKSKKGIALELGLLGSVYAISNRKGKESGVNVNDLKQTFK